VDAWIIQNPGFTTYDEPYTPQCVGISWIGQKYANELLIDLETGRPEPCYENYPDWTAVAQATSLIIFNSTDCSGDPYFAGPGGVWHFVVNGELYEPGAPVGESWGLDTDEPVAHYPDSDGVCKDRSNDTFYEAPVELVPGKPEFIDYFDNPPYTVKIVY
jgi:hypothetical protein